MDVAQGSNVVLGPGSRWLMVMVVVIAVSF